MIADYRLTRCASLYVVAGMPRGQMSSESRAKLA